MDFSRIYKFEEISESIRKGKRFFISADEEFLKKLPKGNWIGGTNPYFTPDVGGILSKDSFIVTELPDFCEKTEIKFYDEMTLSQVYLETPAHGFNLIIIPALTEAHLQFAMHSCDYPDFATRPLLGWISGVPLDDLGKRAPKVINGQTLEMSASKAIAMQVDLDPIHNCEIGIVNIFHQGSGDAIEFPKTAFKVSDAIVNGERVNFAQYVQAKNLNTKLPLVADYAGVMVNVSFQTIDPQEGTVDFYAPVFTGMKYKQADPVSNYVEALNRQLPKKSEQILFSCNCILNVLFSEKLMEIKGPITFGEIAYQLMNQTIVYLKIQGQKK